MSNVKSFVINNVEYYQLRIGCPVCVLEGRPTTPTYWYHSEDGADMFIGDNGYYYCKECGYTAPVIKWGYECSDCKKAGHEKAVVLDDLKHVAEAMTMSGMVSTTTPGLKWLTKAIAALANQCEDNGAG